MIEEIRKGLGIVSKTADESQRPTSAQPGNEPNILIPNQEMVMITRELILDFFDMQKISAPINAAVNAQELQVSAYDFFMEPAVLLDAMLTHAWQKFQVTPYTVSFDANSETSLGGALFPSATVTFPTVPVPNLLGLLFYLRVNDTDLGESRFQYTNVVSGVNFDWSLVDQVATTFVWSHTLDERQDQSFGAAAGVGTVDVTFAAASAGITDSFYLNPFAAPDILLEGLNVVITAYPVTGRDAIYNAMMAGIFGDAAEALGQFIVESYSAQLKVGRWSDKQVNAETLRELASKLSNPSPN